jgi:uncharacterized domain HDIG
MAIYRVKQFFWSVFSKISDDDIVYVKSLLNYKEYDLFKRLAVSEQKHSIRVSQCIKNSVEGHKNEDIYKVVNFPELMKLALLHDIGKIEKHLNVIDKSILVILNRLLKGKLKELNRFKKIDVYYNHGRIGAEMLKHYGYSERFLYLIRNHHEYSDNDLELILLKSCDDIN